jgi:hypothetical protein
MSQVLSHYGPVILLWAAVAYKFPVLHRNPRDPAVRGYWMTLLFLALALTTLLPPVYMALGRLSGIPNIARLLGNGLGLVTALVVQAFLFHLSEPEAVAKRAVQRWTLVLGCALVVMASLFVAAPVDRDVVDFTRQYGDAPYIVEYRLVFLLYLGVAAANVARLSWRYAALATRPSLRLGLRFVASGGVIGLTYVTHESLYVVARRFALAYPIPKPETVTLMLVAVGAGLTVIGSTMPAWGPHLGIPQLYRWFGNYRSLQRLCPLWLDLSRACPEVTLLPSSSRIAEMLTVRDLGFRLYRRTVEIRDARLALRPHLDSEVANSARRLCHDAGVRDEEMQATIEAACLAAAIRRKARGKMPVGAAPAPAPPGGSDMSSEVAVLERVARCYSKSPIVREALTRSGLETRSATATVQRLARWS